MVSGPLSVRGFPPLQIHRLNLEVPGNSLLSDSSRLVSALQSRGLMVSRKMVMVTLSRESGHPPGKRDGHTSSPSILPRRSQ